MKIIGLTGGSGSGKGMVGRLMSAFGCRVIDTDALYHNMISSSGPCSEALIERFGTEISTENGGICRPKLSSIVFSDRAALDDLNKIAHAFVREECQRIIDNEQTNGTEVLVIDAPQLFEAGMQDICDIKYLYILYCENNNIYYSMDTDSSTDRAIIGDEFKEATYDELKTVLDGETYVQEYIDDENLVFDTIYSI